MKKLKLKNILFNYKRLVANANKYINTFCVLKLVRCDTKNLFGILLNTIEHISYLIVFTKEPFKTISQDRIIFQVMFMDHNTWAFWHEKSMCITNTFSFKKMLKSWYKSVFKTFMINIIGFTITDTFNGLMVHYWYIFQIFFVWFHEPESMP